MSEKTSYQTADIQSGEEHRKFTAYLDTASIPAENACGFCHSLQHRAKLDEMSPGMCSDCHIFINGILEKSSPERLNVHQTFQEQKCSTCHDPHAGEYPYQLKKPLYSYEVKAAPSQFPALFSRSDF